MATPKITELNPLKPEWLRPVGEWFPFPAVKPEADDAGVLMISTPSLKDDPRQLVTWNGVDWTQAHPTTVPPAGAGCEGYNVATKQLLGI